MRHEAERRAARLARVRRVRELEERAARGALSEALARATHAEARLDDARAEARAARTHLAGLLATGELDAARFLGFDRAVPGLDARVARLRERAIGERLRAERAREQWSDAERARRALERLTDRATLAARAERERAEAAVIDELAGVRDRERRARAASTPARPATDQGPASPSARPRPTRTP